MQASILSQHAGTCRWLWNHLLAMQKEKYAADGTFIFFYEMSKMLPNLKKEFHWLAHAPSNSLGRVCRNLDSALKKCFHKGAGFPRFKTKGKSRDSFYVANHVMRIDGVIQKALLPKLGQVRFRSGRHLEGRIVGGNVAWNGRAWELTVQCEVDEEVPGVLPSAETVIGVDLGLKELMARSDGATVKPPKSLRKAMKRLRRAQRTLARRKKSSANRNRQARIVGRIHAKVRDTRRDAQHQATSSLVNAASAVVTESLNIKGMVRNRHLALSISDAGWGEILRQITYKCLWSGKPHIKADRFEPSTQRCSACGTVLTGEHKLRLHHRTFRCACGAVHDRDRNAATNLRRIGLDALGLKYPSSVGQAMPERAAEIRLAADACGEASGGRGAPATLSHASRKQEADPVQSNLPQDPNSPSFDGTKPSTSVKFDLCLLSDKRLA